MAKKVLQCEYCRHIITEDDSKCPNCGANCVNVIKKYKEEVAAEEQKRVDEFRATTADAAKAVGVGFGVFSIIPIVIFIFVIVMIGIAVAQSNKKADKINSDYQEKVKEQTKKDEFTVSLESYELYKYQHEHFDTCNTKDGYQRIAFQFVIENKSDKTISTTWMVHNVTVKADSEVVKSSSIHASDHFCNVKQGKKDYNDLEGSSLLAGDKESGYKGYEVPTSAEKLKFVFDDDHIIEIDNPVYKKN